MAKSSAKSRHRSSRDRDRSWEERDRGKRSSSRNRSPSKPEHHKSSRHRHHSHRDKQYQDYLRAYQLYKRQKYFRDLLLKGGERISWEVHHVQLARVPGFGFGIAVSGGRDNPHFTNGDPSIAISDVLKAGPAEGKLQINDRVLSANGISLEGVDYATAVQVLRDSGQTVDLTIKRRVILQQNQQQNSVQPAVAADLPKSSSPKKETFRVSLVKNNKRRDDFGLILGCRFYIKDIVSNSLAFQEKRLNVGDFLQQINGSNLDGLTLKEAKKLMESNSRGQVDLVVERSSFKSSSSNQIVQSAQPRLMNGNAAEDNYFAKEGSPAQNDVYRFPDCRQISFKKLGSVGIRLTGGNEVGIFVTAVQPGSPAASQGLQPGDKLLKVNDLEMKGVTREEAVLYLLSLHDDINIVAQYRKEQYEQILSLQKGDSFYIRTHFDYANPIQDEMAFKRGQVFHVVDTLHNGVVGSWQVFCVGQNGQSSETVSKGVIPNKTRAEEISKELVSEKKKEMQAEQTKTSFFKRKKDKVQYRRSKSLGKDHWEDVVWGDTVSKFPAYEKVSLKHPGFSRPVIVYGPISDIARERLMSDYPGKYASPQKENESEKTEIVRLSAIKKLTGRDVHGLLDVTPNAVDKLNYAQFYPIVIFTRANAKQEIKDIRNAAAAKKANLSSKKLLEQCQKLESMWSHVFTGIIDLSGNNWFDQLIEMIEKQQNSPIWMSETKPLGFCNDVFLLPFQFASTMVESLDSKVDEYNRRENSDIALEELTSYMASLETSIYEAIDQGCKIATSSEYQTLSPSKESQTPDPIPDIKSSDAERYI